MSKAAFIGLGVMGYPMAGHLQKTVTMLPFTTAPPQRLKNGQVSTADPLLIRPPRQPKVPSSYFHVLAMMMICGPWSMVMTVF